MDAENLRRRTGEKERGDEGFLGEKNEDEKNWNYDKATLGHTKEEEAKISS